MNDANVTEPVPAKRRRDAPAARAALVEAARALFAERGYDRATIREIGQRAGVDAALIARYFGGKTQLYIEVLHEQMGEDVKVDILDPARMLHLVDRAIRQGPSPIYQVTFRAHGDAEAQAAAKGELYTRIVDPLAARLIADGIDHPRERAELITAAFTGIITARASGAFDLLPELDAHALAALLLSTFMPQASMTE